MSKNGNVNTNAMRAEGQPGTKNNNRERRVISSKVVVVVVVVVMVDPV
jgi:hypothetical protein